MLLRTRTLVRSRVPARKRILTNTNLVRKGIIPRRGYHERVIEHYENPRNVGKFAKEEEANVGTGLVGAPACGDVMRLQLKIKDGIVEDAKFKTFGCGSAIASSSLATEWVKGRSIEECLEIKNTQIAEHLALPPVKLHCSMLAEDAIRAAIKDYQQKAKEKTL